VLQRPPDSIRKPESRKRKIDPRKASHTRKLDPRKPHDAEDKTNLIAPPPTGSTWLRRGLDILGKKVARGMGVLVRRQSKENLQYGCFFSSLIIKQTLETSLANYLYISAPL
jgi:hypothetical protein